MPPHRPRGHGRPQGANHIDLRYSADALKAISDLQLGSRPRAILKIRPPSSLDYRARHGPQTPVGGVNSPSYNKFTEDIDFFWQATQTLGRAFEN